MAEHQKLRVLLADNDAHIRVLMKTVMGTLNCEVVAEAKDGIEAVEFFSQAIPDIVLLDINLPLKNGIEALAEIMANRRDAFVIMLTSVADMESVKKCLTLGAVNYLRKDIPVPLIRKRIEETLKEHLKRKMIAPSPDNNPPDGPQAK